MTPELASILESIDDKPASYLAAARRIRELGEPGLVPVKLVALSTFTFDLIVPYLVVEGARRGLAIEATVAPFGQLEEQVLDPTSSLYSAVPDTVVIAARAEEGAPALTDGFLALTADAIESGIEDYARRIEQLALALRERSAAEIVIWNQPPFERVAAGFADPGLDASQEHVVAEINRRLGAVARRVSGATIFDVARAATELGLERWFDPKLAHLARCPIGVGGQRAVGRRLARLLRSTRWPPCKCLVLDLDNTLWGGVLGEDGVGGIALGDSYPGTAYKSFQRSLRSYRDRGVLLAIASKNNQSDVEELFAVHSDMVLELGDFAARQIHWNDKASSLRAIADQLGIGLEALALFDDSPVERSWIRQELPEVFVIEVPAEPFRYIEALDQSGAFDQLVITAEDRLRTGQYRADVDRKELERTAGSMEDFLCALQIRVQIGSIDRSTIARIVQLLGKTNQFNVTTRRHTEAELTALLGRPGAIGLWMRVDDRYGDSGLVGAAIALPEGEAVYRLDTFLMSCRVLGRQVEQALLYSVARRAMRRGAKSLLGEFIPTKRNAPAAGFFASCGFSPLADVPNAWLLALGEHRPPRWLEMVEDEP